MDLPCGTEPHEVRGLLSGPARRDLENPGVVMCEVPPGGYRMETLHPALYPPTFTLRDRQRSWDSEPKTGAHVPRRRRGVEYESYMATFAVRTDPWPSSWPRTYSPRDSSRTDFCRAQRDPVRRVRFRKQMVSLFRTRRCTTIRLTGWGENTALLATTDLGTHETMRARSTSVARTLDGR